MSINIKRIDLKVAMQGHKDAVVGAGVLPDTMNAPFQHQYGCLAGRGTTMAGHAHAADEIYIVLAGTGCVVIAAENRAVRAGDTVVIPAGRWHTMLCTEKDEAPLLWAALWWNPMDRFPGSDTMAPQGIHIQRFEKDKAQKAHQDTILADKVVPDVLTTPFDHAYGYLEDGNTMELHSHPTCEFYIVYSGAGYVTVGEEQCAVGPGDVIEIPPNVEHTMTAGKKSAFLWAAFWWSPIQV